MQNVVVVVGGGFVVVVVGGGLVVVVVVVGGGFVVVVAVACGFVVVVVDGEFVVAVVEEKIVLVVAGEGPDGCEVVDVAPGVVGVVVGMRVVVVPETAGGPDWDEVGAIVVVGSATDLGGFSAAEAETGTTGESEWARIKASPPAAVVPSATDPAITATWEPATITLPRLLNWLTIGISNSHASGPMTQRWRPTEMLRNALTIAGSNCVPAQRVSSFRASRGDIGLLYERAAVITSNESATATIRAPKEI